MDKILCAVSREAHERQIEETMDALSDGPERFYRGHLDRDPDTKFCRDGARRRGRWFLPGGRGSGTTVGPSFP